MGLKGREVAAAVVVSRLYHMCALSAYLPRYKPDVQLKMFVI